MRGAGAVRLAVLGFVLACAPAEAAGDKAKAALENATDAVAEKTAKAKAAADEAAAKLREDAAAAAAATGAAASEAKKEIKAAVEDAKESVAPE